MTLRLVVDNTKQSTPKPAEIPTPVAFMWQGFIFFSLAAAVFTSELTKRD